MRTILAALLLCIATSATAQNYQGECTPNYDEYARKIVYLTFPGSDTSDTLTLGTAAWLTPTRLMTIGHTTEAAGLKEDAWSELQIRWIGTPYEINDSQDKLQQLEKGTITVQARLLKKFPAIEDEYIVVVEIDRPVGNKANLVKIADLNQMWRSPQPGDPIFGVLFVSHDYAWPELRFAGGHVFKQFSEQQPSQKGKSLNPELLWAEMIQRPEPRAGRDVAEDGSSGFPIFNCKGLLVGVVANLTERTDDLPFPTAWGTPNIVGVRVDLNTATALYELQR